jgi:hypothetical protein
MRSPGVYKRCGCVNSSDGRRWGRRCPRLAHRNHGWLDIWLETRQTLRPARQWETPTATGWSNAVLKVETSRARVFDDEIRSLATELRTLAGDSVWAKSLESAKETSRRLEQLQIQFHDAAARALPSLY